MSTTPNQPSLKRRRYEESTARLSKPFRSPLIKRPDGTPTKSVGETPSPASRALAARATATTPITQRKRIPTPPLFNATPKTLFPSRRPLSSPLAPSDPEIHAAQKRAAELQAQIRSTKQALELAQQAAKLESSGEDVVLEGEVWKWRLASRAAAETLFGIATDRVNKMGGPNNDGWKSLFGMGKKRNWDSYEDQAEKRTYSEYDDEGIGGEDEREQEEKKAAEPDEEWGMGTMLKGLGIPDTMLGWNRDTDSWIDIDEMV
ncbi:hypothetical protein EDC01DRAFT_193480 [Geopyxis carbonaria]|nr:hypothetical protein EDC01DRAFT_193480 [Geopyxis carbonaria]